MSLARLPVDAVTVVEVVRVSGGSPVERGKAASVAAQVVRDAREAREPTLDLVLREGPLVASRLRSPVEPGEGPLDEAGHGDDIPLEALGRVHGEHLNGPGVHLDGRHFQATFLLTCSIEPVEEPSERGTLRLRREGTGDVGERVEVSTRRRRIVPRPREHLDVESEHSLGLSHEVGQRQTGEQTKSVQGGMKARQPSQRLRREALVVPPTPRFVWQFTDGFDEADVVAGAFGEICLPARHRREQTR